MTNPNFTPEMSTNQIYRDYDDTRCLTDDLDAIEADIEELQTSKADTSHTHTGYANASHTHNYAATSHAHAQSEVDGLTAALTGKADTVHTHDYAATNHAHTASDVGAASASHTHAQSEVTGLETSLANKANASHTHAQADVTDLATTLASKADLVDGKVPESQLPSYVSDVVEATSLSAFPATGAADKIYVAQDTNKTYRWSGSGYVEISASIALGETSATAYRGDRGKIAYDHSQNSDVHVTEDQKTAWNAKQNALVFDTTPMTGSTNPVTSGGVKSALDNKADVSHYHDYAATVHGHAQSEISGLEAALEGKAAASHTHSYNNLTDKPTIPSTAAEVGAIAKALQMTTDAGNVEYEMAGLDIIATIGNMPMGLHTGYCPMNSTNAPLSNEAWRFFVHKTGLNYGWVLAFGSYGSVYSNYINAGTWRGWKNLIDGTSNPLWKHESDGGYYMTANQTITPSKALNQCRNGWVLVWSDYDPDTSATNNADICTTVIPKRNPVGALWGGQGFLCVVPTWMDDDTDGDVIHIKKVYVHNDKLVGFAGNSLTDRRDVVLRAVYEY